MTTLFAVRDGLKASLETIDGLHVKDYVPDDVASLPAAFIFPPVNADYSDAIGGGSITVTFIVMLMVRAAVDRQQLDLYDLLDRTGPTSIYAAIMGDRTLGGLDVDCRVTEATDPLDRGLMASTQVFQRAIAVEAIIG